MAEVLRFMEGSATGWQTISVRQLINNKLSVLLDESCWRSQSAVFMERLTANT